jgi:hypothetical protein
MLVRNFQLQNGAPFGVRKAPPNHFGRTCGAMWSFLVFFFVIVKEAADIF